MSMCVSILICQCGREGELSVQHQMGINKEFVKMATTLITFNNYLLGCPYLPIGMLIWLGLGL